MVTRLSLMKWSAPLLGLALLASPSLSASADNAGPFTLAMKPCQVARPARLDITIGKDGRPQIGHREDSRLTRKGDIKVDGETFSIYLPAAKTYSLKNTGPGDGQFENTSTLISIDANHDGQLTEDEGWFANLPLRIGDRMFEVVRIASDGSSLTLKPSSKPLSGVIVGRKVPPFSYKARDGKTITQDTYRGKALLLDVWSVT